MENKENVENKLQALKSSIIVETCKMFHLDRAGYHYKDINYQEYAEEIFVAVKDSLEYYKIKLKEREFHNKAIYDSFNFVQKSELSREMLIGSDRRERVNQTVTSKRLTKLMGYLNLNNRIKDSD